MSHGEVEQVQGVGWREVWLPGTGGWGGDGRRGEPRKDTGPPGALADPKFTSLKSLSNLLKA